MKLVEPPTNGHKSNIIEVVFDKALTRTYNISHYNNITVTHNITKKPTKIMFTHRIVLTADIYTCD
jgi:hypothetical protein